MVGTDKRQADPKVRPPYGLLRKSRHTSIRATGPHPVRAPETVVAHRKAVPGRGDGPRASPAKC